MPIKAWVTEDAARKLLQLGGKDLAQLTEAAKSRDFHPVPLAVRTSLHLDNSVRRIETANVLGLIPGSDPERKQEVVVYSAHHDHLGFGRPDANGDNIYNGALDNAAGCAQVLAIARAYEALPEPPPRSILIAFVAAEEQGLLGSQYFAAHPTVPPGKIAADVNYDGGNIWGKTRDITFVGLEKSSLGDVVDKYAGGQGRVVKPDQLPDRGYYYRSDQFSFAKIGVPGIYFDTGLDFIGRPQGWGKQRIEEFEAKHYHQPSDEIRPDWTYDGMVEDAQLGFYCGLDIARSESMPAWTPGDEFESVRKAELEKVAATNPPAEPGKGT